MVLAEIATLGRVSESFSREYYEDFYDHPYSKARRSIQVQYLSVLDWATKYYPTIRNGEGGKALDVGCAYGYGLEILESFGYEGYGVDISSYAIDVAESRLSGKVRLSVHDIRENLPFDTKFDLIISLSVLEHLQDPETALKVCFNFLKDDSIFLATTPNKLCIFNYLRRKDPTEISIETPRFWRNKLSRVGMMK